MSVCKSFEQLCALSIVDIIENRQRYMRTHFPFRKLRADPRTAQIQQPCHRPTSETPHSPSRVEALLTKFISPVRPGRSSPRKLKNKHPFGFTYRVA